MEKLKETLHLGSAGAKATGGLFVLKTYKPHSGKERELENVLKTHWDSLHAAGLTTERLPLVLRSGNGEIVEVLEFKDRSGLEEAHRIASLKSGWDAIQSVADLVPLASVAEAKDPYATLAVLDLSKHQPTGTAASIVAKKPHGGKEREVLSKLGEHDTALRKEGLITDRPAMVMRGDGAGYVVEVHEWKKAEGGAQAAALKSEAVSTIWQAFHAISDVTPLADLPDAQAKYATMAALEISSSHGHTG